MAFVFDQTKIEDVILIHTDLHGDDRGFFMEAYRQGAFEKNGIKERFVQDSHSLSIKKVLRGLHYQVPPKAQGKLVRCIRGEIFDVAADIRENSPTFGQWVGVILSEKNHDQLYLPPGLAHGFCVLSDQAEIIYKQTNEYSPEHERGIIWNDPTLKIKWPIESPIIADRDANFPELLKNGN